MRLGLTFIGFVAGFWFSLYFIAAINGIGGMFALPGAEQATKDIIRRMAGVVIELMISCLGGLTDTTTPKFSSLLSRFSFLRD